LLAISPLSVTFIVCKAAIKLSERHWLLCTTKEECEERRGLSGRETNGESKEMNKEGEQKNN
jgi:hypothetical protein